MKDLLGGKGANLAEMTSVLGLPVPPGLHHHHRRLPGLHGRRLARRASTPRSPSTSPSSRRRWARSSAIPPTRCSCQRALRGQVLDAGDDGHRPQPRPQRRVGRRASPQTDDERFAYDSYRRFISMYGRIVLDIDGEQFDRAARAPPRSGTASPPTPTIPADDAATPVRALQGGRQRARPASRSRRTRSTQLRGAIEAVFRSLERRPGHRLPRAASASATTSAPRSTCRRWCSATATTTPAPASASPATPPPARTSPTATSWSTPRARTSWPASATPRTSTRWRATSRRSTRSCWRSSPGSRSTTATCATPSSPSSRASSGCCRPGSASAPAPPRCGWPSR